nr:DUF1858 domain-containing protein [bacterium]
MIDEKSTIAEVLMQHPDAAPVLMEFGMHCLGCPMSQRETLEQACGAHGQDVKKLVEKLNQL